MSKSKKIQLAALVASALFTFSASAEVHTFTYDLDGAQSGTSSTGTGSGTASYDDVSGIFSWNYNYSGLSGTVTVSHFHGPALPGVNGGVQVGVLTPLNNPNIGTATITPTQGADLINGLWYLNVHSTVNPGGEIRGQLTKDLAVDNSAAIAALRKNIKKFIAKARAARKGGKLAAAKAFERKVKMLQKRLADFS
jgi:hypothetical protein